MEQPVYYWDPVNRPVRHGLVRGRPVSGWEGTLFLVGGLVTQDLVVLHLEGERVAQEERVPLGARIRDVKVGPDGDVIALRKAVAVVHDLRLTRAAD